MARHFPINRRRLLQTAALGFGGLALADIVHAATSPQAARSPGMVPKAKQVIFLFMAGGPSQHDLFEEKSFIANRHGQKIDSPLRKEVIQVGTGQFLALAEAAPVKPRGESGMMISDLMPHLASVADDICLLRGFAPIEKHGREHQPESFCAWMAGCSVKGGFTWGETDHMGYNVIDGKVRIHDLHATMLHLLGIDHTKLTWNQVGRDFRLTDVHGSLVKEILA